MATPIGHALAGYAIYSFSSVSQERKWVQPALMCAVMAMAPDFDFLPGFLVGSPALYHQELTHSVGFALMVGLLTTWLIRLPQTSFFATFNIYFISYSSHLFIDFFGPDGRIPYGVPLLWPISHDYFISPVPVFLGMHHAASTYSSTSEWVLGIFSLYNLPAIALEIAIVTPFVLLGIQYRKRMLRRQNMA